MLTEANHSLVDSIDQVLLVIATARGRKPRDRSHPLGMETYFWSFIVAIMVMLAGGVVSIYEGVHRFGVPGPMLSPGLSRGVLGLPRCSRDCPLPWLSRIQAHRPRQEHSPLDVHQTLEVSRPACHAAPDLSALIGIGLAALGCDCVFSIRSAVGGDPIDRPILAGEAGAPAVLASLERALPAITA